MKNFPGFTFIFFSNFFFLFLISNLPTWLQKYVPCCLKASSMIYLFCFHFFFSRIYPLVVLKTHYKFPLFLYMTLQSCISSFVLLFSTMLLNCSLELYRTTVLSYQINFHSSYSLCSSTRHDCRLILGT